MLGGNGNLNVLLMPLLYVTATNIFMGCNSLSSLDIEIALSRKLQAATVAH